MALPSREQIVQCLDTTLSGIVNGTFGPVATPPDEIRVHLDDLIKSRQYTVRDGILVLLAMEVVHDQVIDWYEQPLYNPARAASRKLEREIYPRLHIAGSKEALQTGVKGLDTYMARRNKTWKAVLQWASERRFAPEVVVSLVATHYGVAADDLQRPGASSDPALSEPWYVAEVAGGLPGAMKPGELYDVQWQLGADAAHELAERIRTQAEDALGVEPVRIAFEYLAAGIANTARNLPDLPPLDTPRLTFPRVFALLDGLLSLPSAGAHEQFTFAALLEGWLLQLGEQGVVETKNLNASDASAGTAADVQHKHRGQVIEAYEITAAEYAGKIAQAATTLKAHDLKRVHVLAKGVTRATGDQVLAAITGDLDISVLDVREEVRSLVSRLDKVHRRAALERLYSLLAERQPNDALVQGYVAALKQRGLCEP